MYDEIQRVREKTGIDMKFNHRVTHPGEVVSNAQGYGEELKNLSDLSDDF